jgi:hypothetical protein
MGHGSEHHKEHNPGTGYYRGHEAGTEHEKEECHGSRHHKAHGSCAGHHNEHDSDHETCTVPEDHLIEANLQEMTKTIASLHATIDMLVQKTASIAYHTIASEEILAEIVATSGLNLVRVNERIRGRFAAAADDMGDFNLAINIAAAIASPLPR